MAFATDAPVSHPSLFGDVVRCSGRLNHNSLLEFGRFWHLWVARNLVEKQRDDPILFDIPGQSYVQFHPIFMFFD